MIAWSGANVVMRFSVRQSQILISSVESSNIDHMAEGYYKQIGDR